MRIAVQKRYSLVPWVQKCTFCNETAKTTPLQSTLESHPIKTPNPNVKFPKSKGQFGSFKESEFVFLPPYNQQLQTMTLFSTKNKKIDNIAKVARKYKYSLNVSNSKDQIKEDAAKTILAGYFLFVCFVFVIFV